MSESLRPKGTVEVTCQHPGCGWSWWVDPLDPRLPDGPWDCGEDHKASKLVHRALSRMRLYTGVHWGSLGARGPKMPGACHPCGDGRSLQAGVAVMHDRYRGKHGLLEWSDPSELADPFEMVAKVQWGKLPLDNGIPDSKVNNDPVDGKVRTVGYQWHTGEVREYTFVKCTRPGCPHHVMVDYQHPSKKCGRNDSYSVGSWGGRDDAPLPKWWESREFQCGDGLSTFAHYPCHIVHGMGALKEFEATGPYWTMWSEPKDFVSSTGSVLFYDPTAKIFGRLSYMPSGVPTTFASARSISRSIQWGSLRSLYANWRADNEIAIEINEHVRDPGPS